MARTGLFFIQGAFAAGLSLLAAAPAGAEPGTVYFKGFAGVTFPFEQLNAPDVRDETGTLLRVTYDNTALYGGGFGVHAWRFELFGLDLGSRFEIEAAFRSNDVSDGTLDGAAIALSGGQDVFTGMVNAIVDLPLTRHLTAYSGVGFGAQILDSDLTLLDNAGDPFTLSGTSTVPAFQAFGGFSFPVAQRLELFIEGRYMTDTTPGDLDFVDETTDALEAFETQYFEGSALAGFRIKF